MTIKKVQPYVDFYKEHKISPVSQDISDLKKHYDRRKYLYRRLGIIPSLLRDRSVIEFGPGSGHNALYTYSLNPSRYVLVDGNPTGLRECEKLFRHHFAQEKKYELVECLIEEFQSDELFDLVICEGLIPAQNDPGQFAKTIARFTKPGGVCVVTCHDEVGMLTDLLRCLIGSVVIDESAPFEEKREVLVAVFEKHLKNLKGMSRSCQDWVTDQILHKSFWCGTAFFPIGEAIDALGDSFDVHGVSPFFFTDWRWYKDVSGDKQGFNAAGKDCYLKNIHNFLDYRYEFQSRSIEDNKLLLSQCHKIRKSITGYGYERKQQYIDEICREIVELQSMVGSFSPGTAEALADFGRALKQYPDINPATDWGSFAAWWGRGMQYLSFIRGDQK